MLPTGAGRYSMNCEHLEFSKALPQLSAENVRDEHLTKTSDRRQQMCIDDLTIIYVDAELQCNLEFSPPRFDVHINTETHVPGWENSVGSASAAVEPTVSIFWSTGIMC